MVERLVEGESVGGSIPSLATKKVNIYSRHDTMNTENAAVAERIMRRTSKPFHAGSIPVSCTNRWRVSQAQLRHLTANEARSKGRTQERSLHSPPAINAALAER